MKCSQLVQDQRLTKTKDLCYLISKSYEDNLLRLHLLSEKPAVASCGQNEQRNLTILSEHNWSKISMIQEITKLEESDKVND